MSNEDVKPPGLEDILGSFGPVESAPLTRIQAYTVKAMTHSWTTIPHVTHQDRMDLTDLEAARKRANAARPAEQRLTPLPYLLKAVARLLLAAPKFNAALDEAGKRLIYRKYVNLGVAIDTPGGLVVGVIRDCDTRSLDELATEAATLGEKARSPRGLSLAQMSGGGFTVSSLGALGGDGFTPIINAPEVAILGVGRLQDVATRGADDGVVWRRLLPVCLSYDHRALNGADAGRFMQRLQDELTVLASEVV